MRRHRDAHRSSSSPPPPPSSRGGCGGGRTGSVVLRGWVRRRSDGEWAWEEEEDNPSTTSSSSPASSVAVVVAAAAPAASAVVDPLVARATPTLPSGSFRPKQSLGQNFLRDGNTVAKIVRAFVADASSVDGCGGGGAVGGGGGEGGGGLRCVELGPGAGALTDVLVPTLLAPSPNGGGDNDFRCIEIDARSVELLKGKHPNLEVMHRDVLQVDYRALAEGVDRPLSIIGNLPYYITSQILFALADASHTDSVRSATVTMQYEVGRRLVASTSTKDYGILSVVFQLYCTSVKMHFKIPPTVFYPQPKVDSALMGLHFAGSDLLRRRLGGVRPRDLRSVVTSAFRQRRKTVRNGLRRLATDVFRGDAERASAFLDGAPGPMPRCVRRLRDEDGDSVASRQELPGHWASMRPEELTPGQFVEITRMLYGPAAEDVDRDEEDEERGDGDGDDDGVRRERVELGNKVWRKLKHGSD
jgi:ribosomal RNA small subunit methyltransferase A